MKIHKKPPTDACKHEKPPTDTWKHENTWKSFSCFHVFSSENANMVDDQWVSTRLNENTCEIIWGVWNFRMRSIKQQVPSLKHKEWCIFADFRTKRKCCGEFPGGLGEGLFGLTYKDQMIFSGNLFSKSPDGFPFFTISKNAIWTL